MGQGAYILGCEGPRLSATEAAFFREADPWGFILFARNVESPEQLQALTRDLRLAVGRDAPILVDQEGGRVQRLTAPHWRQWMAPLDHVAASGDMAERSMWLRSRLIADELQTVGIDVNCAPTADVASAHTHPFLRNRCYGEDPGVVSAVSRAVADGLLAGGVAPVIKHIPGHGRALVDSHKDLPRVTEDKVTLASYDFAPFAALADLPMAMTAHIVFQAIDDQPATMSAPMIDVIRKDIGFSGLLMTDDISMKALAGTLDQLCATSLAAGCDVVLHCNGDLVEMQAVANASGAMTGDAQRRADSAAAARNAGQAIDIEAVEEELRTLMNGVVYV